MIQFILSYLVYLSLSLPKGAKIDKKDTTIIDKKSITISITVYHIYIIRLIFFE